MSDRILQYKSNSRKTVCDAEDSQGPLISVIVAVLNGEKTLSRCIESVLNQTYPHKELILLDGGSTDGTVRIIQNFSEKITYWESQKDRGVYHAWNKALNYAKGEWICFIGCDDFFISDDILTKIAPELEEAQRRNNYYAYGKVGYFSHEHHNIIEFKNDEWKIQKRKIKKGRFFLHSGSFHHRRLFERHNNFDESYKISGDIDFILRELKHNDAYFINDCIIGMGMSGLSADLSQRKKMLDETLSAWKANKMPGTPWLLYFSYLKIISYNFVNRLFGENFSLFLINLLRIIKNKNSILNK